jgi:GntR family transcriptional regulator
MRFQVNYKSGKAVYLQIVDQVKVATASGTLRAGDPLPPIRPLAEELRVNRNTVAKAYAELESQGLIETAVGRGCVIADAPSPLTKEARRRMLAGMVDDAAVHAHHMQIDKAEFLRLAEERFDALAAKRAHARRS